MDDTPPDSLATLRVQQLFVRHQSLVRAFILSLQPGFSEADDVLQETFLVVTRRAADYVVGTNFVAWVCTIARLKLLEARRKAGTPGLTAEALAALCEDVPDESFFRDRLEALQACLGKLAPKARELVQLRFHGELGPQEIAARISWKEAAVRVALSKARAFLRDCVQARPAGATA